MPVRWVLTRGDERWRITWKRTISTVATPPVTYSPAPTAMPTPTVAHRPAAVVTPLTVRPWVKMTPTPKKPMAVTTPAATREASREIPPRPMTSKKPYLDTTIISAADRATIM